VKQTQAASEAEGVKGQRAVDIGDLVVSWKKMASDKILL
jgi:hypothetical protein